jgi:hypothetical protein
LRRYARRDEARRVITGLDSRSGRRADTRDLQNSRAALVDGPRCSKPSLPPDWQGDLIFERLALDSLASPDSRLVPVWSEGSNFAGRSAAAHGWPAWLDRGGGPDASRRRLNNQELAHYGAYDAADRDEAAFLWRAGGSGHRSGSERQAKRQEGCGAVEARLFFWRGHAESSCAPE